MNKEELNIHVFMVCNNIDTTAFKDLPEGFFVRYLRRNELEIWKKLPFYEYDYTEKHQKYMTEWYNTFYGINEELFYKSCHVVCNKKDEIIGSSFLWRSYNGLINSIHWFKVIQEYENKGLGRALLTILLKNVNKINMPIYLHTQIRSYRAIKLYTDFGFKILSNEKIYKEKNDINKIKLLLKEYIPKEYYVKIKYVKAPINFIKIMEKYEYLEM